MPPALSSVMPTKSCLCWRLFDLSLKSAEVPTCQGAFCPAETKTFLMRPHSPCRAGSLHSLSALLRGCFSSFGIFVFSVTWKPLWLLLWSGSEFLLIVSWYAHLRSSSRLFLRLVSPPSWLRNMPNIFSWFILGRDSVLGLASKQRLRIFFGSQSGNMNIRMPWSSVKLWLCLRSRRVLPCLKSDCPVAHQRRHLCLSLLSHSLCACGFQERLAGINSFAFQPL